MGSCRGDRLIPTKNTATRTKTCREDMGGDKVGIKVAPIIILVVVMAALHSAEATTYIVGDNSGWTNGASYTDWVSGKTFVVGDTLEFNFVTGLHTVTEVSESDYASCSGNSPISAVTVGPAKITLGSAGTFYYICSVGSHCSGGQKLSVVVSASSSSPTPGTPPTSGSPPTGDTSPPTDNKTTYSPPPPPPPPSSASSLAAPVATSLIFGLVNVVALF